MIALILGLLIFQFIFSIDKVFPKLWNNVIEWHKSLFEPMEIKKTEW